MNVMSGGSDNLDWVFHTISLATGHNRKLVTTANCDFSVIEGFFDQKADFRIDSHLLAVQRFGTEWRRTRMSCVGDTPGARDAHAFKNH